MLCTPKMNRGAGGGENQRPVMLGPPSTPVHRLSNSVNIESNHVRHRCKPSVCLLHHLSLVTLAITMATPAVSVAASRPSNLSLTTSIIPPSLLSIEDLLFETKLEDAMEKLRDAWNSVHADVNSDAKISSSRVQNRSRRNIDESGMTADDGRVYGNTTGHQDDRQHQIKIAKSLNLVVNCTRCVQHDRARSIRIENIKFSILSKLGMERPPNVSLDMVPKIPRLNQMLSHLSLPMLSDDSGSTDPTTTTTTTMASNELDPISRYLSTHHFGPINTDTGDDDEEEFFVNAEKSIVFAREPPKNRLIGRELRAQHFEFSSSILNTQIQRATLWLYLKGSSNRMSETGAWIVIYQVVKPSSKNSPALVFAKSKRLYSAALRKGGWIQIEIKKLANKWFQNPEQNYGIAIHSYDSAGEPLTIIHYDDVAPDSELRPFLEVRVNSRLGESRKRRMLSLTCDEKSAEVRCCRYPLTVDFEKFGWDWIIAPKQYEANYCSGECSYVFLPTYPHTHIVQQTSLANTPCCSPRKMKSISMLYLDDKHNIIYGILPNMVVDRCGCS